jgi:hypothetical protein
MRAFYQENDSASPPFVAFEQRQTANAPAANRAPIISSERAWRWQRLSFSGLRRSPLPFSAPLAYSWLSEICRP